MIELQKPEGRVALVIQEIMFTLKLLCVEQGMSSTKYVFVPVTYYNTGSEINFELYFNLALACKNLMMP